MTLKILNLISVAFLSLAACGGLEPELALATEEAALRELSPSDHFIRDYGINGDACFLPSPGSQQIQCVSADRRSPMAIGDAVPKPGDLCNRTSTGGLTGCQADDPEPYICAFGVCGCSGYQDCLDLSVEQLCKVHLVPCEGCSEVYGVCTPGTLDI
jgi:hypothetical protein